MLAVAIDDNNYLAYEGDGHHGHAIWPSPVFSIATVLGQPKDVSGIPASSYLAHADLVFREDSFDPVTRIRRGRLYKTPGTQPQEWHVKAHPAYTEEPQIAFLNRGWIPKRLFGFYAWPAFRELEGRAPSALIALGNADAYTIWRVVDIERIVTGEDLLTLRARATFGVLPELNSDAVPEEGRAKVLENIERLSNAAYRAGPEDIVESARAVVQWCLGVYVANRDGEPKHRQRDLGELSILLQDKKILQSLIPIFARLHSRAKPNEQERYESRPILEDDAEFALTAVGLMLREIGWTY